jgi:O-antigen ligase
MNSQKFSLENTLLYLIYTGFFLILITPLLYTNTLYYPYVTLKGFSFRFAVEALSLVWFILILKNDRYFPMFQPLHLCLMVFMAILAFANSMGIDPSSSMWGNLERMDGLITIVHLFAYMVIASSILVTKKHWFIFANFSLVIALIVSVIGLYDLTNDSKILISSTLGNSGYLAIYSLIHFFVAVLLYFYNKEKKYSFFYLIFLIISFMVLYNTGSRGGMLSFFFGLAIALIVYKKKHLRIFLISGVIILFSSGALLWSLKSTSIVQHSHSLKRFVDIEGSSSVRFKLWTVAIEAIKEKPLAGWGQENFHYTLDRFYDSSLGDAEPWFDRAHNIFLDWAVAAGLPGLIAYISIFVTALFSLWRTKTKLKFSNVEKSLLAGILIAYAIYNFFIFESLTSSILFFAILSFISIHRSDEHAYHFTKKRKAGVIAITACFVLFMGYCFYFVNLPALKTTKELARAIDYFQEGHKQKAVDLIEEVSSIESFAQKESYEQLALISPSFKTLEVLKKSAHTNPLSLKKSYLYLATAAKNKSPELEEIFLETTALSPTRQIVYLEMIYYYLRLNNFEKAFEFSKFNYDINPRVNRSKSMYALCAVLINNIKLSEELIADLPLEEYVHNKMFIEAYRSIQRKDKIIEFYQKSVEVDPKDPDNHLNLGMIYSEMGKNAEAAREFELSKELTQKKLSE